MKTYHIHIDDSITPAVDAITGQPVGISAKSIRKHVAQAKASGAERIVLHMNSGGGSVYEGFEIYNILNGSGLEIEAAVESLSASIATLIMLAGGDKNFLSMAPTSQLMFHKPSGKTEGTITDHQNAADNLGQIEELMAQVYAQKIAKVTGSAYDIQKGYDLMNKGDYFVTPSTAQSLGVIDAIRMPLAAHAKISNNTTMTQKKKNTSILMGLISEVTAMINPGSITAGSAKLADGNTSVYFEGETLEVGKDIFTDEAMTTKASAGEHVIEDGRTIVVDEAGVCIEIKEPIVDELEEANARIEELESELATANQTIETERAAHTATINAINVRMSKITAHITSKEFKAGAEVTTGKAVTRTGQKSSEDDGGRKTRGLEEAASKFNRKANGG